MTPQASPNNQTAQLRAEAIAARRARRSAWQNAHVDRLAREREARKAARDYQRLAEQASGLRVCSKCKDSQPLSNYPLMPSGNPHATCRTCKAAMVREAKRRKALGLAPLKRGQKQDAAANSKRILHLAALLTDSAPDQRISDQQTWEATASELKSLWAQSGEKECAGCSMNVPPSAMLPPGPANFYPGKCRSCAQSEREANIRVIYGPLIGPLRRPTRLRMRDGSSMSLAEFARRVEERSSYQGPVN